MYVRPDQDRGIVNDIPKIEGPGDNFKLNSYLPQKINPVFVPMISIKTPMKNEIITRVIMFNQPQIIDQ